jgi:hypothetical protein
VTRGAAAGVGLFAPIVGVVLAARMLDRDLVASFQQFARSIILGDFGRGWIFVWQYLWAAEGFLLIVWLLLAGLALNLVRGARFQRVALWLGLALAVYAGLVLGADVLRTFVVYGRTARMLVPLLCLAAAAGADALAARWSQRWIGGALLIAMAAGAAGHMAEVLQQKFPDEFRRQASQRALLARKESPALMRMLNAEGLFAGPVASEPRPHTLLLRQRHPLQFEPALFEGFNEERRRQFQRSDISMQLVAVPTVSLPDMGAGYPGPVRLRVRFPGPRPGGEPLLTCGEPRKANFFYVQYPDPGHIRIGYDCWGRAGRLSEPIPIDYSREHEVILSCDALLPPGAQMPAGMSAVEWARLQGSLLVAIDGAAILTDRTATNPAAASSIFAGANLVGGSTANEWFSGEILSVDRASWADVAALFEPDWTGYPGPLRLQVRVPRGVEGTADPLVVSGVTGGADFVYVRYLSDDRVSLGYDHWGAGGPESRPLRLGGTRLLNIVVSHGGLMPPQDAGFYRRVPTAVPLRNSVVVAVDDQVVLRALASPHSSTAKTITLGQNLVGGSTTTGRFGGDIVSARSEPVDAVLRLLKGGPVSR